MRNENIQLTWEQLKELFRNYNDNFPTFPPLHAVAVASQSNFGFIYPLASRSYHFTSDNKLFRAKYGQSCFAESLSGDDPLVDLSKTNWVFDYCYLY